MNEIEFLVYWLDVIPSWFKSSFFFLKLRSKIGTFFGFRNSILNGWKFCVPRVSYGGQCTYFSGGRSTFINPIKIHSCNGWKTFLNNSLNFSFFVMANKIHFYTERNSFKKMTFGRSDKMLLANKSHSWKWFWWNSNEHNSVSNFGGTKKNYQRTRQNLRKCGIFFPFEFHCSKIKTRKILEK